MLSTCKSSVALYLYCTLIHPDNIVKQVASQAAGAGQADQAKTGPLFSALGLVVTVNCIVRMVKIVT